MSCDLPCSTTTRGPTSRFARGLLTAAALAAVLTACGGADGGENAQEAFTADTIGVTTTPVDVPAPELDSAEPVAADAPEIEPVTAALAAQEAFVPSDPPAGGSATDPGDAPAGNSAQQTGQAAAGVAEAAAELDPEVVAAAQEAARGPALQEILATLAEFEHQGWEQRGTPVVVGEPVTAPLPVEGGDGEAARVTVCLDSSDVTVVDRDGNVVRGPEEGRKALHNYDLFRQPGQSWQVVQHGFPGDPTC